MKNPLNKPQMPHGNIKRPVRQVILDLIEFTVADLVRVTGLNPHSIRTEINRLLRAGIISSSSIPSELNKVGRPSVKYQVTNKGRKLLTTDSVQEITTPIYDIASAIKILRRFTLADVVRLTNFDTEVCQETLKKFEEDGWIKPDENDFFQVESDLYGVTSFPQSVADAERIISSSETLVHDNEYYLNAIELLREFDTGSFDKKETILEEIQKYLKYARQELDVILGERSVSAAYIDAVLTKALLFSGQHEMARKLSIGVLNTFLENSLFEDAKELVASLDVHVDIPTDFSLTSQQRQAALRSVFEITRQFASTRNDIDTLLYRSADLICRHYDYDRVGIVLTDVGNEYTASRVTNTSENEIWRHRKLQVGRVVGKARNRAAGNIFVTKHAYIVPGFKENSYQSNDHSEMVVPLQSGGRVFGILNVRSSQAASFDEINLNTLQLLSDQLSLAIENARLYEETNRMLSEYRFAYEQNLHSAWNTYYHSSKKFNLPSLVRNSLRRETNNFRISINPIEDGKAKSTLEHLFVSHQEPYELAVPMKLGDMVIGVLSLSSKDKERERNWSDREIDLANLIADNCAIAFDNARLYDEMKERENRERLVSEITSRINSSSNIESILQDAAKELSRALEKSKFVTSDEQTARIQIISHSAKADE